MKPKDAIDLCMEAGGALAMVSVYHPDPAAQSEFPVMVIVPEPTSIICVKLQCARRSLIVSLRGDGSFEIVEKDDGDDFRRYYGVRPTEERRLDFAPGTAPTLRNEAVDGSLGWAFVREGA